MASFFPLNRHLSLKNATMLVAVGHDCILLHLNSLRQQQTDPFYLPHPPHFKHSQPPTQQS